MICMARITVVATAMFALAHTVSGQRPDTRVAQSAKPDEHAPSLLERPARLNIEDVSLEAALNALTRASGVPLAFSPARMPRGARTSCSCADVDMRAALDELLAGTSLEYVELSGQIVLFPEGDSQGERGNLLIGLRNSGRLAMSMTGGGRDTAGGDHSDSNGDHTSNSNIIVRRVRGPAAQVRVGTIIGTVTEAGTSTPVVNAQIAIDGGGRAFTDTEGRYRVTNVPPGHRSVSVTSIGYRRLTQEVEVADGATVTLDFALELSPTTLNELVVTATGEQRRVELGNAITTIRADSVASAAPVMTLSDLLTGRAPGVQVFANGGLTGAAPQINIRGQSSLSLSNQPLMYIDGVRVDNSEASNSGGLGLAATTAGAFNDIQLQDIESVEIVRGPSASTLYGTDAANGVILVRTRRGAPATAPRWRVFTEFGVLNFDRGRFSDIANRSSNFPWGHPVDGPASTQQQCPLGSVAAGACVQDSLSTFSPLMDPETTPIGSGRRALFGVQLSGGREVSYFLSGSYEEEIGYLAMPLADRAILENQRGALGLRDEELRPNAFRKYSFRSNVGVPVGSTADLRFTSSLHARHSRIPSGTSLTRGVSGVGFRDENDGWRGIRAGESFLQRHEEDLTRFTGSVQGEWRPTAWLQGRATAGADFSSTFLDLLRRQGEGFRELPGARQNIKTNVTVLSGDLGLTASYDLAQGIAARSSVGLQYNRRNELTNAAGAEQLVPGAETVAGGAVQSASESTTQAVVAGAFLEQSVGLAEYLFVTAAIRADGGSTFGQNFKTAVYPKASVSWLVTEGSFFPRIPGLASLRLRTAFGASGVQPSSIASLARERLFPGFVDGIAQTAATLQTPGNPNLGPERQREWEIGMDVGLLDQRIIAEATYYHKRSEDALVDVPLPESLGGGVRTENIGAVRNSGLEWLVRTRVLEWDRGTWQVEISGASNHNKLLSLGPHIQPTYGQFGATSIVPGYPVHAFFDFPILGYDDANGNAIIEPDEVLVDTVRAFAGPSYPTNQLVLESTISLGDRLRMGIQLDRRSGHKVANRVASGACSGGRCRAVTDPNASLREQAAAVAYANLPTNRTHWAFFEDGAFTRLRELSFTYALPFGIVRRVGADDATVTLAGRNLALWTAYSGVDPEVSTIVGDAAFGAYNDTGGIPPARYWILRLDLGF